MRDKFQKFNTAIADVVSPAVGMFGTGMPGMAGASAQMDGELTPAADEIRTLRRLVAELNQEYTHKPDPAKVKELSDGIEGSLLGLESFSIMDQKTAYGLIDQLRDLTSDAE